MSLNIVIEFKHLLCVVNNKYTRTLKVRPGTCSTRLGDRVGWTTRHGNKTENITIAKYYFLNVKRVLFLSVYLCNCHCLHVQRHDTYTSIRESVLNSKVGPSAYVLYVPINGSIYLNLRL